MIDKEVASVEKCVYQIYHGAVLWLIYCNAVLILVQHAAGDHGIVTSLPQFRSNVQWIGHAGFNIPENAVRFERQIGPQNIQRKISAVVANHHKTGTFLFKLILQYLCPKIGLDYEFAANLDLSRGQTSEPEVRHVYINGTGRALNLMHGFVEDCPRGDNVWDYCDGLFDVGCWINACHVRGGDDTGNSIADTPFVNTVRNPAEVVISAYLYHQQDSLAHINEETWLRNAKPDAYWMLTKEQQDKFKDVPYYKVLQQVDPVQGLQIEFAVESSDLYSTVRHYKFAESRSNGMNVQLERAKTDYSGMMTDVFTHLGILSDKSKEEKQQILQYVDQFDLKKMPSKFFDNSIDAHVTKSSDKNKLRRILYENQQIRDTLEQLAKELGYKSAFNVAQLYPDGPHSHEHD